MFKWVSVISLIKKLHIRICSQSSNGQHDLTVIWKIHHYASYSGIYERLYGIAKELYITVLSLLFSLFFFLLEEVRKWVYGELTGYYIWNSVTAFTRCAQCKTGWTVLQKIKNLFFSFSEMQFGLKKRFRRRIYFISFMRKFLWYHSHKSDIPE